MDRREELHRLGCEDSEIDSGNIGYELESQEGYFARERAENCLADGLSVDDEFIPDVKSQYEKDLYRWNKQLERLELERCQEDKSQNWGWSDKDEREWIQECKDKGYPINDEGRIAGIDVQSKKNRISSLLTQGVLKLTKKQKESD